jgi:hypothetical protein
MAENSAPKTQKRALAETLDITCHSIPTEAPKVDLTSLFGAKEVRVKAGEPLKLALGITGSPTVTWLKDGKPIDRVSCLIHYQNPLSKMVPFYIYVK